jgi:phage shock protein PspC (stress-responsive transcriptional regulator)
MVERGVLADAQTMTTQATAPIPEPPTARRLTRSSSDRVIAGVAGGLGRYFGIDPVVVRVMFVVLVFFGGAGFVGYAAAWLLVPYDNAPEDRHGAGAIARRLGLALGVIALAFVAAAAGAWGVARGGGEVVGLIVIGIGAALAIAAFTRGARWLIVPALALTLAAGSVAAADIDASGSVGEQIYHPTSVSQVQDEYRIGAGHLLVDLRDVEFDAGEHRVRVEVGVGQAEVLVPEGVCVSSRAHVAIGATEVFLRETGGLGHDWHDQRQAAEGDAHLTIVGDVGVGQFRVEPVVYGRAASGPGCDG